MVDVTVKCYNIFGDFLSDAIRGGVHMNTARHIRLTDRAPAFRILLVLALFVLTGNYALAAGAQGASTDWLNTIGIWSPIASMADPSTAYPCYTTAVWAETELILWGGMDSSTNELKIGWRYSPASDTWNSISSVNAPTTEGCVNSVWTGTKMIVWGYVSEPYSSVAYFRGGSYNPKTNSWSAISSIQAPDGWVDAGIWTGTELILWNGPGPHYSGRYNPVTDTWAPVSSTNSPVEIRHGHTIVWTGTEMIVWGGTPGETFLNTGARYNPATDTWVTISNINAPQGRNLHGAVWTGTEMIIWGGWGCSDCSGGRYNPATDTWAPLSSVNVPEYRVSDSVVWTGTEMIVWGGMNSFPYTKFVNTGARYNPLTDTWTSMTVTNAPSGRRLHMALWTGTEMLIWGGDNGTGQTLNSGGRYHFIDVTLTDTLYIPLISNSG